MSKFVRSKFSFTVVLLILVTLIGSYLMAMTGWFDLSQMVEMTNQRRSASVGRIQAEKSLSLLKDLETGARGYLLTGHVEYLEPYDNARGRLPEVYVALKTAVAKLPIAFSWDSLDTLMTQRLEVAAQIIRLRQRSTVNLSQEMSLLDQGKETMDAIREEFKRLNELLLNEINKDDNEVARLHHRGANLALIGSIMATILLASIMFMLWRESRRRNQLEISLLDLNNHLEQLVAQRTEELQFAQSRLTSFAENQERSIEEERRRLAREVHDQIGQVFTAIKLIIESIPAASYPVEQRKALDQALDIGISTTRRIATELRPPLLDDLGLQAAFEYFLEKLLDGRTPRWEVDVRESKVLNVDKRLVLFRLTQEAVTNALRHAPQATHLNVRGMRLGDRYHFEIEDDGGGFELSEVRADAVGLLSMRERVALAGGKIDIVSSQERGGTLITAELPLGREL